MEDKISKLQNRIDEIVSQSEIDFSQDKMNKLKPEINSLIQQLDEVYEDQQLNKKQRGRIYNLKGKILDVLPEYSQQAEEVLSKALKLDPSSLETWNTLGHILWKKKDYLNAKKMFEGAIEQCGKNKQSLRYLSIVLRCIGNGSERNKNVEKSIELANEAVKLDLKDGESWYVLGNAYLSNFFVNLKTIDELKKSLQAYIQAEKNLTKPNPDLFYNRGTIFQYLEDYKKAIEQYNKASELDSTLQASNQIQYMQNKVNTIVELIKNRGKIKQKRLQNMVKTIPTALRNQVQNSQYTVTNLSGLKEGINKGFILTCKITHNISKKGEVPATFLFTDSQTSFAALSIYNTSDDIYDQVKENADVYIVDPMIKNIKINEESYSCIQVFDIKNLFVDFEQVIAAFSPSMVVNETFQNQVNENSQKQ
ncbi:hypothetical protein PPERSA_10801 [Pseudocohnilembus persalinus]|uniref:Tetratricopeptide repeat protein 5 OB fold domain-containing protein n=1 Tax=Pseudocohnilembus persalinus TaxID=266149 RepID=A0A0V0QDN1_PSEPJ|nr:hypothetical protein PPERSA_10801 [Pseudocohnilembus persalinus]|eukprot:KRX00302.1 hypothetical protein PPERSA_10801 [Pseudocohnilembus persalinus]